MHVSFDYILEGRHSNCLSMLDLFLFQSSAVSEVVGGVGGVGEPIFLGEVGEESINGEVGEESFSGEVLGEGVC